MRRHDSALIGSDLDNVRELFGDRYTIESRLPWNGLAFMYRARRQSKPVVVAVLPVDCGSSRMMARIFEERAEQLLTLDHPALVRLRGYGIQRDIPFLELERVGGFPMASAPSNRSEAAMPGRRAVRIVQRVLEGLQAIHDKGQLHLDVTPANVLIQDDEPRLLGGGLAPLLQAVRDDTATGPTGRGSGPQAGRYLAPEIRIGDAASARSDVYSAGALLYRLLTGEAPPKPGDPVGTVPRRLVEPLATAMARDPDDRYESAEAFRDSLEHVLAEVDEEDMAKAKRQEVSRAETLRPMAPTQRNMLVVGGAMVVGAVVIAVGIAVGSGHREAELASVDSVPADGSYETVPRIPSPPADREEEPSPDEPAERGPAEAVNELVARAAQNERPVVAAAGGDGPAATSETSPQADGSPEHHGDLLAGDLPYPLAALRESLDASALGGGPRLDRSALAPASRWALAHPDDPRGHLLLAEAYMRLGWAQDALDRYIVAFRAAAAARDHQRMLTDLLELARRDDTGEQAAGAVLRIYGRGGLPAVDEVLASGDLRWHDERRLRRLRSLLDGATADPRPAE